MIISQLSVLTDQGESAIVPGVQRNPVLAARSAKRLLVFISLMLMFISLTIAGTYSGGTGTDLDPYQIDTLDDLEELSLTSDDWTAGTYFIQTADIDASDTENWNSGAGFSPIGGSPSFRGSYDGQNHIIYNLTINRSSEDFIAVFGRAYGAVIQNLGLENLYVNGNNYVGGMVGYNEWGSLISHCYVTGSVIAANYYNGGLTSYNFADGTSNIDCHTSVFVEGGVYAGGIVGNQNRGTLTNLYSTGYANGSNSGGLVANDVFDPTITSCYWDMETSNLPSSAGGTGKTSAEMKTAATFTGWTFDAGNWQISEGSSRPFLAWQDVIVDNDYPSSIAAASCAFPAGNIHNNTGSQIFPVEYGYMYKADEPPTWNDCTKEIVEAADALAGNSDEVIAVTTISGLQAETDYYCRSYVTDGTHVWLGDPVMFTTEAHPFTNGTGTEGDPYQIASLDDLQTLSENSALWGSHFIQTANIIASATSSWNGGAGFSPIGDDSTPFSGTYDGQDFSINGLTINRPATDKIGLFGETGFSGTEGTVQNLVLTNANVTGSKWVGALVGNAYGPIVSCSSTGSVTGNDIKTGGLAGQITSDSITDSYSTCTVNGTGEVGGLLGFGEGGVSRCTSSGSVTGSGDEVGGLIGFSYDSVDNSYAFGSVNGSNSVGGLMGGTGYNTITNCYSTGAVSGSGGNLGGLIGSNSSATVNNSFWDTETSLQSASAGGTGKTTAEMLDYATYTDLATSGLDAAWDFIDNPNDDVGNNDDWGINSAENNGYPFLEWQGYDSVLASPEMVVSGNSLEILDGDTQPSPNDHTNFGNADVDGGTVIRTFTIENTGDGDLTLTDVSPYVAISGPQADDFEVTALPDVTVIPSGSTTFQVTFDPSDAGFRSAVLSIANNDSDENPYNFTILGRGQIYGCTDPTACNYDAAATIDDGSCLENDCNGDCGGSAIPDACGICSEGNSGHTANEDIDDCNVCPDGTIGFGSNNPAPDGYTYEDGPDCNLDCFGTAFFDDCGICSGGNSGHTANNDIDICDVCPDGTMGLTSNDPAPDGYTYEDGPDCNMDCFGTAFFDDCGICSGGNSGHTANIDIDDCDVCPDGTMGLISDDPAPDGYTYEDGPDCNMECFGTAFFDDCGICSGGNSGHTANIDIDDCDVCPDGTMGLISDDQAPDGYTYEDGPDCNMECFGTAFFDDCGICSGGNSGHTANIDIDICNVCPDGTMGLTSDDPAPDGYTYEDGPDCNMDCFGTAFFDDCGICSGGNSGHTANIDIDDCDVCPDGTMGLISDEPAPDGYTYEDGPDCNMDCFGAAFFDDCGICSGGNSGHTANFDIDICNVCPDGTMGQTSDDPAPDGYTYEDGPDCNMECFGTAFYDDCGICSGGNSGHTANIDIDDCDVCPDGTMGLISDDPAPDGYTYEDGPDCNMECFGTAFFDDCGICSGGNSGHTANIDIDDCDVCPDGTMGLISDDPAPDGYTYDDGPDCNMDCFGTAFFDDCGICSEGNSGHTANFDIDICNVCPDGTMGLDSDEPAPNGYTYEDGPDCHETCFGTATIDECSVCCDGTTGVDCSYFADQFDFAGAYDCAGVCFGLSENDVCGVCDDDPENDGVYCFGCADETALNFNEPCLDTYGIECLESVDGNLICDYQGDFNDDQSVDIADIIAMLDLYLYDGEPTEYHLYTCDLFEDETVNILDVVMVIEIILGETLLKPELPTFAVLTANSDGYSLDSDGSISAVELLVNGEFELVTEPDYSGWMVTAAEDRIIALNLAGCTSTQTLQIAVDGDIQIVDNLVYDWDGGSMTAAVKEIPDGYALNNPYPNPFNPVVNVQYEVPDAARISVIVYDITGRQVVELVSPDHVTEAGYYTQRWNAESYTTGIYFVRMQTANYKSTRKIILLK